MAVKGELVLAGKNLPAIKGKPPAIVVAAGRAAQNAWRDFFAELQLENPNTHRSYNHAVRRFLTWCQSAGKELGNIMPGDVAEYLKNDLGGAVTTQKVHRSALKRYFDLLVVRHICLINPVASVKTPRLKRTRGTTEMIEPDEIRTLVASIPSATLSGLRDRAIVAVLGYTACRANGIAHLRRGDYRGRAGKMRLVFNEKGGNELAIEVRSDLEECLDSFLAAARMKTADKDCPFFRTLLGKQQAFRDWIPATKTKPEQGALSPHDVCRMVNRRMKAAGLREELSTHSFRVAVITDLISQRVPIEDVQQLAGHADPRTTKLYDRSEREVTRNLVERIGLNCTEHVPAETAEDKPSSNTLKVELFLVVENNSKWVRGKGKSTREIEYQILSRYNMQKPDQNGHTYILEIPKGTDKEIEDFVYDELLGPANQIADLRNGFLIDDTNVRALDGSERHWG